MDILSEVLRVVRLSGVVHFRADFTRPWAIVTSPPDVLIARVMPGAESVTPFHVVSSGTCILTTDKLGPIQLEAGDVIVFPRGDQHTMASDPGLTPVPTRDIYQKVSSQKIAVVKHGGGGEPASFICGFLHSDQRFGPLLESLPALLWIRSRNGVLAVESFSETGRHVHTIAQYEEAGWWQATLRYFISETAAGGPGGHSVLARLSELLFMQVMRWQLSATVEGRSGWLAGLSDPQIGRALTLMHAEPQKAWTVEDLAGEVAMSRAAFADRFVELVGEPPMQYLAGWRMHLARHLLRDSGLGIGEVAGRVGYESEAAFNRAFRRAVGTPPAAWRRNAPAQDAARATLM